MIYLREIYLYYCSYCLTVKVSSTNEGTELPRMSCLVCKTERLFEPIAIDFDQKKFLSI